MSKSICTTIQRELDEKTLGEDCSVAAFEHLAECGECSDFRQKQTKLREIVGSLGTVSAPPDFEFRLRSRLARDNDASRTHLINFWSLSQRSAAVATVLVLLIGGALLVRQRIKRNNETPRVAGITEPARPATGTSPGEKSNQAAVKNTRDEQTPSTGNVPSTGNLVVKRTIPGPARNKRNLVALDSGQEQAPVFKGSVAQSDSVFPVDASQQSLTVSLLDGRGNRRTISVPTVTFGSQRVVPATTSFAPKGVW